LTTIEDGLVDLWGDRDLASIRKRDVIAFLGTFVDRDKGYMANRVLAALRKMFNWAVGQDIITASPCTGIERPTAEVSRERVLTKGELRLIWNAAGADGIGWPFGPIIRLLILTGQRRTEVGEMRWSEIDLENKTWKLPRGRVKNNSGHEVPLSAAAVDILKSLPHVDGGDFVFTTTGTTAVSGFSRAKDILDRKTGIAEWRLHDLRRTAATFMAEELHVAPHVIEAVLNHMSGSKKGVAGIYNRATYATEKRTALDAWSRYVLELVATNVIKITKARAVSNAI
jgi:integrase